MCMSVHPPEMEVQTCGKDCKDCKLDIMQHVAVGVPEEQRCQDVRYRDQKTECIIGYVMINQDNIQTAWVFPPGLYGAYEREYHESQLEYGKENKWYEKRDIGRALVARCDPRDRARCVC